MERLLLIAADYATVRAVQLALRSSGGGFQVVATLDGRVSARGALADHRPDVVLIDDMCQRSNALARLHETVAAPEALVVLLTSTLEDAWLGEAFAAGADAVLDSRLAPTVLGHLLREISRGTVVHAPRRRASSPRAHPVAALELAAQTARTSA